MRPCICNKCDCDGQICEDCTCNACARNHKGKPAKAKNPIVDLPEKERIGAMGLI